MDDASLVLLTDSDFAPALETTLLEAQPNTAIAPVSTLSELDKFVSANKNQNRLVAFCTDVIVPPKLLKQFDLGAYNFHPGPPEYPGLFPSCFAIYEGVSEFGTTAHTMTDEIDAGEIVGTDYFDIEPDIDRFTLDGMAFQSVMRLFRLLAPKLTNLESNLATNGESWRGKARRKKDFLQLCELPPGVTESEFSRRYRAVGEGPYHALTLSLFGHRFKLSSEREDDPVFRGGQPSNT